MFNNRRDAGQKLARALEQYKSEQPLILAIPRGGVEVGLQIAQHLKAQLTVLVVRKLPLPDNPEAGFGAIAEDGSVYLQKEALNWVTAEERSAIEREQKEVLRQRVNKLRGDQPLPEIKGRTVILVDDGIAMGSTMLAAVALCKKKKAGKIIVAAPVAGPEAEELFAGQVDDLVILETPSYFRAVAQAYREWHDATDEEVVSLLTSNT